MTTDGPDLGEQALSKVAEAGISSQLDDVENIDVDIRTNPGKLIQGKVDSVAISGKGLLMNQDLRMDTLEVTIDKVEINPLSAMFGNIELTRPSDAEAEIVLTEADINRAFSSEFIREKLRGLTIHTNQDPVVVDVQESVLHLPGENKFVINAEFLIREQGEVKKLSATAIPKIQENGNRISLEVLSSEAQGLTAELQAAILMQLTELLDLRNFNIPGISLQLHRLEAQQGRLLIHAKTQIEQLPSA
jgi:LmeA-like phospholipid-binding